MLVGFGHFVNLTTSLGGPDFIADVGQIEDGGHLYTILLTIIDF